MNINGNILLDRDTFRPAVFERDGHRCVICGKGPADEIRLDAHHIIERRLWPDGGYYLNNGATLCDDGNACHLRAEQTIISCDEIRAACGVARIVMPPFFRDDEIIDKWGNGILPDGRRTKGPLFEDESVRKAIAPVLSLFTDWVKYPRTWHLPFSPGMNDDDKMMTDLTVLKNARRLIVTLKMDGENTSMYRDYVHARSLDSRTDCTRHWVKNYHSQIGYQIDDGWRVCGENMWAKHSIFYGNLEHYFYGFSIWDDKNVCQSWDDTLMYFDVLGIKPVPVIYDGPWDEQRLRDLWQPEYDGNQMEGYVLRVADAFHYRKFSTHVAKFVRANHIRTSEHWKRGVVTMNELKPA